MLLTLIPLYKIRRKKNCNEKDQIVKGAYQKKIKSESVKAKKSISSDRQRKTVNEWTLLHMQCESLSGVTGSV